MARPPEPRLRSWQEILANLSRQRRLAGLGDEYGAGFSDPELAAAEREAIGEAEQSASGWLRAVWPLLLTAMLVGSAEAWSRAERATEEPPAAVATGRRMVHRGMRAGRRMASGPRVRATMPAQRKGRITGPAEVAPPLAHPPSLAGRIAKDAEWQAMASSGLRMREWAQGMREDVRWQTVQAIRDRAPAVELARRLSERWGKHGQDFAMVASTELSDAYACGILLALPQGSFVTVPPIHDNRVCPACRELLEQRVFEVLHAAPLDPARFEAETQVWPGKSNMGRPRDQWLPCIPLHPRCRHLYVPFSPAPVGRDTPKPRRPR